MGNSTFPREAIIHGGIIHGGINPGELEFLGLSPDDVIDFSVNVKSVGVVKEMGCME
ncbi:MAG: hypothetical protein WDZ49_17250 [Litorilinea sp.]